MPSLILKQNNFIYLETSKTRETNKKIKSRDSLQKSIEVQGIFNGSQPKKQVISTSNAEIFLQE